MTTNAPSEPTSPSAERIKIFLRLCAPSPYMKMSDTDPQILLFENVGASQLLEYRFDQIVSDSADPWSAFESCSLPLLFDLLSGQSAAWLISSIKQSPTPGYFFEGATPGPIQHTLALLFAAIDAKLELNIDNPQAGPSNDSTSQIDDQQINTALIKFNEELRRTKADIVHRLAQSIRTNLKQDCHISLSFYAIDSNEVIHDLLSVDELTKADHSKVTQMKVKSAAEASQLLLVGVQNWHKRSTDPKLNLPENCHSILTISVCSSNKVLSSLSLYYLAGLEGNGAWTPVNHKLALLIRRFAQYRSPDKESSQLYFSKLIQTLQSALASGQGHIHLIHCPPTTEELAASHFLDFTRQRITEPDDLQNMLDYIDKLKDASKMWQYWIRTDITADLCDVPKMLLDNQEYVHKSMNLLDRMSAPIKRIAAQLAKHQQEADFEAQFYKKRIENENHTHISKLNKRIDDDQTLLAAKDAKISELYSQISKTIALINTLKQSLPQQSASNAKLKEKVNQMIQHNEMAIKLLLEALAQNQKQTDSRIASLEAENSNLKVQIQQRDQWFFSSFFNVVQMYPKEPLNPSSSSSAALLTTAAPLGAIQEKAGEHRAILPNPDDEANKGGKSDCEPPSDPIHNEPDAHQKSQDVSNESPSTAAPSKQVAQQSTPTVDPVLEPIKIKLILNPTPQIVSATPPTPQIDCTPTKGKVQCAECSKLVGRTYLKQHNLRYHIVPSLKPTPNQSNESEIAFRVKSSPMRSKCSKPSRHSRSRQEAATSQNRAPHYIGKP